MKPIRRSPLLTLLLALAQVAVAGAAEAQRPDSTAVRIQRVEASLLPLVQVRGRSYAPASVEARMRQLGVPAASIAVIHDGKVEWARAYGVADVVAGRPATTGTLFQAASISKPVAATAALRLVEEGRLSLDEPVNDRLTSWKIPASDQSANRPVTLRDLLTHSAGLTVHGFPGYASDAPLPSVVQLLDGVPPANTAAVRVDTEPGTKWRYSGGGTTVVQLLLSDLSGIPFPRLMRETVLAPIGMSSSTYEQPLPAARALEAATAYRADGRAVRGRYHTYPEMAAAGLWTTPTDLARWVIEIQRALAGDSGRVLSKRTAEWMLTPGVGGWGLGPSLRGAGDTLIFEHGGANAGFRAQLFGFAHRGEGVVVMTNSDAGGTVAMELAQAVAREYGWPGFPPGEIVPTTITPAALAEYVGRYSRSAPAVEVSVSLEQGALFLRLPDGTSVELVPTGRDAFASADSGAPFEFVRDDGRVVALSGRGTRLQRVP